MPQAVVQADEVLALLDAIEKRARDLSPAMRAIAQRLRADILRNFREGGWFPEKWEPSKRALKEGGRTLVDKGVLRDSMHAKSGADFAAAGSDVKYAAIHQFGGAAGIRHSAVIPARPFLPVDRSGRLHPATERFAADALLKRLTEN